LYQLHWRAQNKLFWTKGFTLQEDEWEDNIHEVPTTLDGFVKEGKIRHMDYLIQNAWGIMRFLRKTNTQFTSNKKQYKIHILIK
jgi:aryl-alcohol dehydrogenase-like predicted oxidoreductase